jgi:hypothetical protein
MLLHDRYCETRYVRHVNPLHVDGYLRHCAAILSKKSLAMASSGPFRGLMKTMRSFGCDFLVLIRWIPRGMALLQPLDSNETLDCFGRDGLLNQPARDSVRS